MTFAALQPFADRAALFTAIRQDALTTAVDALGPNRWDVDTEAGTLTFTSDADPSRQIITRAHLVATIAPEPRSLLWAWAHPQGDERGVSAALRAYGVEHGIAELATGEVAFPADAGDESWIAAAAATVGGAAVELTGHSPYFAAPVGGGTYAVFLLDAPLAPLTLAAAASALPRVLAEVSPADGRTAVWDLARLAGWNLTWKDDAFSAATIADQSATATFEFDEHARVSGLTSSIAPQIS